MATTDEERREVAERLRRAADSDEWLDVTINNAIFGVFGEVRRPIADTLADLIDPSTSATTFTPGVGLETYPPFPIRLWKCARCGEETIMMYDEGEPVACPYCGAVVVSDDD